MTSASSKRTFVGFGFGAIQAGLFLYEAFRSGNFERLVVAEVVPAMVDALRRAKGEYVLNIAHPDRIETVCVGPVEVYDPAVADDRARLMEAVAQAAEIATAVPSVNSYASESPGSLHRLLAAGLRQKARQAGPRAVVYTAENHNHAAEILAEKVSREVPTADWPAVQAQVCFLNTVIGKMSGVVTDPAQISAQSLGTITPDLGRAFLVEVFNRILISAIHFRDDAPFQRGIQVFIEKPDLLPFEEAKLYGHNATHALLGYLGAALGLRHLADLQGVAGALDFARAAFIEESGGALLRKYGGMDLLFTPSGYRQYADDLLARMVNPFLADTIERVTRDPQRKLGWNDRLIGTIRLALRQGIRPQRYAFGAVAALTMLSDRPPERSLAVGRLRSIWQDAAPDEMTAVFVCLDQACRQFEKWQAAGFPDVERFVTGK